MRAKGIDALARRFGRDLQVLEQQLGGDIESAEELTRLTSGEQQKASFKITLHDGRHFKLRRFKSEEDCASVVALSPLLKNLNFSQPIFVHGMAAIEQWITGSSLAAGNVSKQQVAWAAGLLGQMHTITGLPDAPQTLQPDGKWYLNSISGHLADLVEHAVLDSTLAQNLFTAACQAQPTHFEAGLIHGDFCAENMVVASNGDIVVIDNESLRVGELDYDIARCWSRWPMTDSQRSVFAKEYRRYRDLDEFNQHQDFWAIKALSQTICVRLQYDKPYQPALDALKRISDPSGSDPWPKPE